MHSFLFCYREIEYTKHKDCESELTFFSNVHHAHCTDQTIAVPLPVRRLKCLAHRHAILMMMNPSDQGYRNPLTHVADMPVKTCNTMS